MKSAKLVFINNQKIYKIFKKKRRSAQEGHSVQKNIIATNLTRKINLKFASKKKYITKTQFIVRILHHTINQNVLIIINFQNYFLSTNNKNKAKNGEDNIKLKYMQQIINK